MRVELLEDQGQNSPHFAELKLKVRVYTSFFLSTSAGFFLYAWAKHKAVTQVIFGIREQHEHRFTISITDASFKLKNVKLNP